MVAKKGGSDWRQVFAMANKQKNVTLLHSMRNERYQRTFTDELFKDRPRPGFKRVSGEQKAAWEILAGKGDDGEA